jgi:hypothetical protein
MFTFTHNINHKNAAKVIIFSFPQKKSINFIPLQKIFSQLNEI